MTIFVLKLDLWCLVITSFSKVDATTQIMAFMNIYMEINLLDFKFQPEHRLLLLCVHCCITEGYTGLLGPSLGLHPCLFSLTFGLNLGSDCGERILCGFSTVLAKPLSFHRGRWPPSGTSPCLMLVSRVEVKKFSSQDHGKNLYTMLCANFVPGDWDISSTLYARRSGTGFQVVS